MIKVIYSNIVFAIKIYKIVFTWEYSKNLRFIYRCIETVYKLAASTKT